MRRTMLAALLGVIVTTPLAVQATRAWWPRGANSGSVLVSTPLSPRPLRQVADFAFRSTWDLVGTSPAAIHDNGKWPGNLCDAPVVAVVPSTGLSMPTPNAFRWAYDGTTGSCYLVATSGKFSAPSVGQSAFYRFYYRNDVPNGQDLGEAHWLQAHSIRSWEWKTGTASGGKYSLRFVYLNYGGKEWPEGANINQYLRGLSLNTTYRIEQRIRRITATTAKVDFRVSDSAGKLRYTTKDFVNDKGVRLNQSNPILAVSDEDFHSFELGNNGPARTGKGFMYVADFAVRISADSAAWIGK